MLSSCQPTRLHPCNWKYTISLKQLKTITVPVTNSPSTVPIQLSNTAAQFLTTISQSPWLALLRTPKPSIHKAHALLSTLLCSIPPPKLHNHNPNHQSLCVAAILTNRHHEHSIPPLMPKAQTANPCFSSRGAETAAPKLLPMLPLPSSSVPLPTIQSEPVLAFLAATAPIHAPSPLRCRELIQHWFSLAAAISSLPCRR
ncbi:hypothetical protein M0R45_009066 [Rubus argutus]|uniref:Uncharacterized protein n=1 Tax=Rubus argutus TaxID=59490 RepID=A0AAW1Y3F5_RUBAR